MVQSECDRDECWFNSVEANTRYADALSMRASASTAELTLLVVAPCTKTPFFLSSRRLSEVSSGGASFASPLIGVFAPRCALPWSPNGTRALVARFIGVPKAVPQLPFGSGARGLSPSRS